MPRVPKLSAMIDDVHEDLEPNVPDESCIQIIETTQFNCTKFDNFERIQQVTEKLNKLCFSKASFFSLDRKGQQQLEPCEEIKLRDELASIQSGENAAHVKARQRAWVLTGMLDQALTEAALSLVVDKQEIIGMVPNGYLYPELLFRDTMPDELAKVLANKRYEEEEQLL